MILGSTNQLVVGIDIVAVNRFRFFLSRFGARFSERIFTPYEWQTYGRFPLKLAARFAVKEAVGKALGTGLSHMHSYGIPAIDVETRNEQSGAPKLLLYRAARDRAKQLGIQEMVVSLSHNRDSAVATVIGYFSKINQL